MCERGVIVGPARAPAASTYRGWRASRRRGPGSCGSASTRCRPPSRRRISTTTTGPPARWGCCLAHSDAVDSSSHESFCRRTSTTTTGPQPGARERRARARGKCAGQVCAGGGVGRGGGDGLRGDAPWRLYHGPNPGARERRAEGYVCGRRDATRPAHVPRLSLPGRSNKELFVLEYK
jgi:hypothetical protein